jgi:hypothetical protein
MPFNPLVPVTDYQSMLNRIFWFTTAAAFAAVWLLRVQVPALDASLSRIDFAATLIGGKTAPTLGGCLLPALVVGIATRVFGLHERISDWLEIREDFDVEVIITELAHRAGVDLVGVEKKELRRARHRLMREAFYPFVSGPQPAVDHHLIQQALDAWSWFWIGVVSTALFIVTGLALVACGVTVTGLQVVGWTLLAAVVCLPAAYGQCRRYAVAQVRTILDDPERTEAVREAFAGLFDEQHDERLAA